MTLHIHWHKVVSVEGKYFLPIYVQTIKKKCRCGSVKTNVESFS